MSEKRGRKPTERGAYNPNPARQLGRVSDEDWEVIQKASAAFATRNDTRESLVGWALPILLRAAKREIDK